MPRIEYHREYETTLSWAVFLERDQVVELFGPPQIDKLALPGGVIRSGDAWIRFDMPGFLSLCGIALSRRDVVLELMTTGSPIHRSEHSGPWLVNGKTLVQPVYLCHGDQLRASVRALGPDAGGPVAVQLACIVRMPSSDPGPGWRDLERYADPPVR